RRNHPSYRHRVSRAQAPKFKRRWDRHVPDPADVAWLPRQPRALRGRVLRPSPHHLNRGPPPAQAPRADLTTFTPARVFHFATSPLRHSPPPYHFLSTSPTTLVTLTAAYSPATSSRLSTRAAYAPFSGCSRISSAPSSAVSRYTRLNVLSWSGS